MFTYDPSGHAFGLMASQSMFLKPAIFLWMLRNKLDEQSKIALWVVILIYLVTQVHACFAIMFTFYQFHYLSESIGGLLLGYIINYFPYWTDYEIFCPREPDLKGKQI